MPTLDYQNRDDSNRETGVLRKLFGPSKEEIWRQLAEEVNGQFIDGRWFGPTARVEANCGQWTVTLDTFTVSNGKSSTTYTRMRAPYVNRDGFRFNIYRAGIFTGIGKFFGMQDVEIGDPYFDEPFVIQGNSERKLRELLANERIKEFFHAQPHIRLSVKDDEGWFGAHFPDGVDELYFVVTGVLKDFERLHSLFYLFAEVLEHLCRIGSAYEDAPNVRL